METVASTFLGLIYVGSLIALDNHSKTKNEYFSQEMKGKKGLKNLFKAGGSTGMPMPIKTQGPQGPQRIPRGQGQGQGQGQGGIPYPQVPLFYHNDNNPGVASNNVYARPVGGEPIYQQAVNLNSSGSQMLEYQLYQQAVNAATPTQQQLDAISGEPYQQVYDNPKYGVSPNYAPFEITGPMGPQNYYNQFQAVNIPNSRATTISACAQNSPTFLSTPLLPKPSVPGSDSWDIGAPQDILAIQNFLSAVQQLGVDTVSSSLKNPSYDIRGDIPNPINVVAPWNNTSITPDLERRPLQCDLPQNGVYGCADSGMVSAM